MGLLGTTTQESYYNQSQTFTGDSTTFAFTLNTLHFDPLPSAKSDFEVFISDKLINPANYSYVANTGVLTFLFASINLTLQVAVNNNANAAPITNNKILVRQVGASEQYGNYQFIGIDDVISNFIVSYVGEDKIVTKVKRSDIAFHAQRAIQEFSYDTFKSTKSQEIEIPPSLTMPLPQDYVNYVKLTWKDSSGVERIIYPTRNTSNPLAILQDSNFKYIYDSAGNLQKSFDSTTWDTYKSGGIKSSAEEDKNNLNAIDQPLSGKKFGLTPEYAQLNGSFFIDPLKGVIYFSSGIAYKTVTLKYITDGLGTDSEMVIHKFAEDAMYKYLVHAVVANKSNVPEYLVNRLKKEKFASKRVAKLRLSNLKSEEITQIMRNKSKQIKH
jgi:hypothetical protein